MNLGNIESMTLLELFCANEYLCSMFLLETDPDFNESTDLPYLKRYKELACISHEALTFPLKSCSANPAPSIYGAGLVLPR